MVGPAVTQGIRRLAQFRRGRGGGEVEGGLEVTFSITGADAVDETVPDCFASLTVRTIHQNPCAEVLVIFRS